MFTRWCPIQTFILLISSILNSNAQNHRRPLMKDESIFTEVLRNISRFNNVLQELIQNYETLQKLYESKSIEKDYSTDVEIDEVFKSPGKKNPRTNKDVTDHPLQKDFPATAMIVSEENEFDSDSGNDKEVKVKKVEKDKKNEELETSSALAVPELGSFEKGGNTTFVANKSKRNKQNTKDKANEKVNNEANSKLNNTLQDLNKNVQKIIQFESFPTGKIWDDIANKKPINLKIHKTLKDVRVRRSRFGSKNTPKTALVILAKNEKKQTRPSKSSSDESSNSEEEDKDIKKEFVKANILRHAYGEACMKVVVKKCHKACKKTRKIVCRMFKCKSSLKRTFKKASKAECIKQFRLVSSHDNNESFYMKMKNRLGPEFQFFDATREGFPAEACYPFMKPLEKSDEPTKTTTPKTPYDREVNILRDRYERACQRASTNKCKKACLNAYKTTCDTYVCEKGKKKAFKKQCKKQCKFFYKYQSSSSSSRSSSDDSDYDDDSDSK